jgi:mono/diheme cytochrome c family protein
LARLGLAAVSLGLALTPLGRAFADPGDGGGKAPAAAGDPAKGKTLFANAGCGGCHTLADAGATGQVGPPLDGDSNLSRALVVSRVTDGQGPMPAFGGQLSDQDIADIAAYVTHAATK